MPAPRGRGGARGGGIAKEGRHDELAQGGADGQKIKDQFTRDRERIEKRKREGRQGRAEGSPPRRDSRFTHDSDSTSVEATPRKKPSPTATRMVTRRAEKEGRDTSHQDEGSPIPSSSRGSEVVREIIMNDIMQQLLDAQRMARERERKEQEKEDRYREEIRQLQTTVVTLVLDIKSL
jgi:hypothetical protein